MSASFGEKHPPDRPIDEALARELKSRVSEGRLPCAVAFDIAKRLNVPPEEVGFTLDVLEIRLFACQLGLFGYEPNKKIVEPAREIDPRLRSEIREHAGKERLSCKEAWEIAGRLKIRKMAVSAACESLGVKIGPCQLGAF